jgi:hypothetical protein
MAGLRSTTRETVRIMRKAPVPVHQGFWRCTIGPLPVSWHDEAGDAVDTPKPHTAPVPEMINSLIKTYICNGLSQSFEFEYHYKFRTRIPTQEDNQYDGALTITMLADQGYENWWGLHRYMDTVMSGITGGFPVTDMNHRVFGLDGRYRNRLTFIPYIDIHCADDNSQERMIVRFKRCRITTLADLQPNPGSVDPVPFNISVLYELKDIIRLPDPNSYMSAICVSTSSNAYDKDAK